VKGISSKQTSAWSQILISTMNVDYVLNFFYQISLVDNCKI